MVSHAGCEIVFSGSVLGSMPDQLSPIISSMTEAEPKVVDYKEHAQVVLPIHQTFSQRLRVYVFFVLPNPC
jgi:hypothetical protein